MNIKGIAKSFTFTKLMKFAVDLAWYALCVLWVYILALPFIRLFQTGRIELLLSHTRPIANTFSLVFELGAVYIALLSLITMSYCMKCLVKRFIDSRFFEKNNVLYVKITGLSITCFGLMPIFMSTGQFLSRFILSPVRLTHDAEFAELIDPPFLFLIIFGIIVYLASAIFKKGVELDEEQRFTV